MSRHKSHDRCATVIRKPVFSAKEADAGMDCGHRRSHHSEGKGCAFCKCRQFTEPEKRK